MNLLDLLFRITKYMGAPPHTDGGLLLGLKVDYGRIKRCPWKKDITIDRSSFVGGGHFDTIKGTHYHSVSCSADGPNPDGVTMHHGYIGYWPNFSSFEEANKFAGALSEKIRELTGFEVPIYASSKDKNAHAGWCMSEGKTRPKGIRPDQLPVTFKAYM